MRHFRMRTRLFLITACTILIPLSILSFLAYRISSRAVLDAFVNNQIGTMKKVGSSTDSVFSDIEKTSLLVITNADMRSFLLEDPTVESRWNAYSLLAYLKNSSPAISSLHLAGTDDQLLTLGDNSAVIFAQDRQLADAFNGASFWARDTASREQQIYMCRLIRDVQFPAEHLGYLKIYVDMQVLSRQLYPDNNRTASYYLLDTNGCVLYASDLNFAPDLPEFDTLRQYELRCHIDPSSRRSISVYPLSSADMLLVGVSTLETLEQQNFANGLLYISVALCSFLFCLLLSQYLSRKTLQPLTQMLQHMQQLEQEKFDTRIDVHGDPELETVARQFNSMASKIQSLIVEVYSVSVKRKEAELRALQTQIKPHFLYNTLDLAYWNAQAENALLTAELIHSLSQFFRFGLASGGEFTTLKNELEHLRCYILLQRQHNPDFDFELDVDDSLYACKVVRLILQPLVENAFVHGIADRPNGQICVRISLEEQLLVYDILDNGPGVDEKYIQSILALEQHVPSEKGTGIGLKNVHDRIQLAFGAKYGISIYNCPSGGTCVHVIQPYLIQEARDDKADDRR